MSGAAKQSRFFKGIYEFEDPSGALISAKVPTVGTIDLYSGTAVVVKPNQCAVFIYQGKIADVLFSGTHEIKTENVPVLTKLANWKFGFESPLRCELVFISGHIFTSRRWGSPQPVLVNIDEFGPVPIRAYGNFNVVITAPKTFFTKLVGTKSTYSITDLEEFIQGQIVEFLPDAFAAVKTLPDLGKSYNKISQRIEAVLNKELSEYRIAVQKIQVLSAIPSKEIIEAIDAKAAIKVIGSQKEYLLYKAANSLGLAKDGASNDPMQMMMGLMLGKGLIGADYHDKEEKYAVRAAKVECSHCGTESQSSSHYCGQCGKRLS